MWDPSVYLDFADHRARPFHELLARIGASAPRHVVDLGCGAGNLTVLLAERWPKARLTALDSSPDMVAAARDMEIYRRRLAMRTAEADALRNIGTHADRRQAYEEAASLFDSHGQHAQAQAIRAAAPPTAVQSP